MEPVKLLGIAWYREDEWGDFKAACVDREVMADSYEAWKRGAERGYQEMSGRGAHVHRVEIHLRDFLRWCEEQGVPANGKARTNYVNWKLNRMYKAGEIEV